MRASWSSLSPIDDIVSEPLHPYSKLLLESVPGLDEKKERLVGIPGMPPRLHRPAAGLPLCAPLPLGHGPLFAGRT